MRQGIWDLFLERSTTCPGCLPMAAHLQVAKYGHANKSRRWIVNGYFGTFNRSRRDRWVFGDRDSGAYRSWSG
jgi:hypothetical protein